CSCAVVRRVVAAKGGRRPAPLDGAGQNQDGEQVREHLDELRRPRVGQRLDAHLHRVRQGEEQRRQQAADGVPLAKDVGGQGHVTPARGHVLAKPGQVPQGQLRSAQGGQSAGGQQGEVL